MYYTRESYSGQTTADSKRMHGRGIFTFANGNRYVGTFHDGEFHGQGILFFTEENGHGQFRGLWRLGRLVEGDYIFSDGLEYKEEGWTHCTEIDRQYWHEYLTWIRHPDPTTTPVPPTTIIPDYSTTSGIPPAFTNGKPRRGEEVTDVFWQSPRVHPAIPEHAGLAPVTGNGHDMADAIADTIRGYREGPSQVASLFEEMKAQTKLTGVSS